MFASYEVKFPNIARRVRQTNTHTYNMYTKTVIEFHRISGLEFTGIAIEHDIWVSWKSNSQSPILGEFFPSPSYISARKFLIESERIYNMLFNNSSLLIHGKVAPFYMPAAFLGCSSNFQAPTGDLSSEL